MPAPKQTDPQFKLRMPKALKDKLDNAVYGSGRTLNAEIVWRLEQTFDADDLANDPATAEALIASLAPRQTLTRVESLLDEVAKLLRDQPDAVASEDREALAEKITKSKGAPKSAG